MTENHPGTSLNPAFSLKCAFKFWEGNQFRAVCISCTCESRQCSTNLIPYPALYMLWQVALFFDSQSVRIDVPFPCYLSQHVDNENADSSYTVNNLCSGKLALKSKNSSESFTIFLDEGKPPKGINHQYNTNWYHKLAVSTENQDFCSLWKMCWQTQKEDTWTKPDISDYSTYRL